jgi:hypothetical protein
VVPYIIPDPVDLFINQVSAEYDVDIITSHRGYPYLNYVRSTTILILWRVYGLSINKLSKKFNLRTPSVYYNIKEARANNQEYYKVLDIFIDTMKRFINLNKQKQDGSN